jgi:hypothetical protein
VLDPSDEHAKLHETLLKNPVLCTNEITIRSRDPKVSCETRQRKVARISRTAAVEVRAGEVTIKAPNNSNNETSSVTLNAVLVTEVDPPKGESPVEWMLLTSLPISNLEAVRLVIYYYTVRWMIEIFFRTLKSGCRVEERRFETLDRMLACLAVYMVVAWRTLYLCRLGRACPDVDCEVVFDASEWQSVWAVTHPNQPLPENPPKLQEMVRLVARLGGYVDRKNEPGVETVWKGLQRAKDLAWGWNTYGPGKKSP